MKNNTKFKVKTRTTTTVQSISPKKVNDVKKTKPGQPPIVNRYSSTSLPQKNCINISSHS